MSLAIVHSRATLGIEAPLVTVEVHLSGGLPAFNIVGLPKTVVKESRERVRSAILNTQLEFPQRRITVNLAPADLPKTGGRFDLAIALGILAASGQLDAKRLEQTVFMGELALSGEVRRVNGILPGLMASHRERYRSIVPRANAAEAGLLPGAEIALCGHLLEQLQYFRDEGTLQKPQAVEPVRAQHTIDFSDVVGQDSAKRALLIAAAGGHNLLMRGPPGTGKTMLASRLVTILPPLTHEQALEVPALQSISNGGFRLHEWHQPPFRAPHHTSLGCCPGRRRQHAAHRRDQPRASRRAVSRRTARIRVEGAGSAARTARSRARAYRARKIPGRLPASFQLVAACNPCPCGYQGDAQRPCRCTEERIKQYRQRISGPLLDRIDLQVDVPRLSDADREQMLRQSRERGPDSATRRAQVLACRETQLARTGCCNARLEHGQIKELCALGTKDQKLLNEALNRLRLSARACFRILKIARTIADLADSEHIAKPHLLEAINYRRFDTL